MISDALEDKFESIAEEAIRKAQNVPCRLEFYIDGLQHMISIIQEEIAAAKESGPLIDGGR